MKTVTAFIITAIIFAGTSCKKFLAAYSQNQTFLTSVNDLEELLVGEGYYMIGLGDVAIMDDDVENNPGDDSRNLVFDQFGIHFWQRMPELNKDGAYYISYGGPYYNIYEKIATLNTILFNAQNMKEQGASANKLQQVTGETHFLRACYYFLLVNIYGKPYSSATAASDYGIPLKLTPEVQLSPYARNSVQLVYNQIEADLLTAEKELEGFNISSVHRANQAVVQAFLSRMYLYREEYEKAVTYANKVMEKKYKLSNMNTWMPDVPFVTVTSPEIIHTMASGNSEMAFLMDEIMQRNPLNSYKISEDLLNIFPDKDLRWEAFFKQIQTGDFLVRKAGAKEAISEINDLSTIRLPELYLNKAEALAVLGRNAEAIATVQELRKNRYKPEDLTAIDLSGAQLVNFIRDERRRELCFELHRWFDLRRYGVNSKYPYGKTIRHRSIAWANSGRYTEGYYELKPYPEDPAGYVLPIPQKEIDLGKGIISNEERPQRPLLQ